MKTRSGCYRIILFLFVVSILGCREKSEIDKLIDKGAAKFEAADFAGAEKIFAEVIKKDPKNQKAYFKRLSLRICLESNLKEYVFDPDASKNYDPTMYMLFYNPATFYGDWREVNKKIKKRKEELLNISDEISAFTKAIEKQPNNARLYFGRGLWHDFLCDGSESIKDFSKAIKLDKNFEAAYIMRGKSNLRFYTPLIEVDGGYISSVYYEKAFYLRRAYQINNNNKETLHLLYYSFYTMDSELRLEILSKILAIDPSNKEALWNRARELDDVDNYKGALQDYERLVKISPDESEYWYKLGEEKIKLGWQTEALADLNKAKALCKDQYLKDRIQQSIRYLIPAKKK